MTPHEEQADRDRQVAALASVLSETRDEIARIAGMIVVDLRPASDLTSLLHRLNAILKTNQVREALARAKR